MGETAKKGPGRRKACDLCFKKKIKCDAREPACSHCILYNEKCLWTANIYKTQLAPRRRAVTERHVQLEIRVAELEDRLKQMTKAAERAAVSQIHNSPESIATESPIYSLQLPLGSLDDSLASATFGLGTAVGHVNTLSLPSLQEVLSIVEHYFSSCNQLIPLFDERKFKRMLHNWYATTTQQDEATWAAINVVLALSLQQKSQDNDAGGIERSSMIKCLNNVQSVLTGLVTRTDDLKGMQVLLGLTMLLQGTSDTGKAVATLVASAVKLAHRLRLHRKPGLDQLEPSEERERERIFWITYILDRDISMRARDPYLIQPRDSDVELPDFVDLEDAAGILIGADGRSWFNFFRCRVHLARIEGLVHDRVYSVQAERLPGPERTENTQKITAMLRDWRRAIPDEFSLDRIHGLDSSVARTFASIYLTECHTLYMAHRVYSHDYDWMRRLTDYSNHWTTESHDPQEHEAELASLLPPGWKDLVASARVCVKLFRLGRDMNPHASFISIASCTCISALIILVANKLSIWRLGPHDQLESDEGLIQEGLEFLKRMMDGTGDERFRKMYAAGAELNSRAAVAVRTAGSQRLNGLGLHQQWHSKDTPLSLDGSDLAKMADGPRQLWSPAPQPSSIRTVTTVSPDQWEVCDVLSEIGLMAGKKDNQDIWNHW